MNNTFRVAGAFAAVILGIAVSLGRQPLTAASGIDAGRIVLPDSVHPLAQVAYDWRPAEAQMTLDHLVLLLGATAQQDDDLRGLIDRQQTPGSPDFHRWLTSEQLAEQFGPSRDEADRVTTWLKQQGFTILSTARSRRWIEFSGTVQSAELAFGTDIHQYVLDQRWHIANATPISIPSDLASVVRGVLSLNDFDRRGVPISGGASSDAESADGSTHSLAPGDFAAIYDLNPLYAAGESGARQTIAVIARADVDPGDIRTFRSLFGLPPGAVDVIHVGTRPGFVPGDSDEATFDAEWAGALAPNAAIKLVVGGTGQVTSGIALAAMHAVDTDLAGIITMSFNNCEAHTNNAFWNSLWAQAAAMGISVIVSSGDTGAFNCEPSHFSSTDPAAAARQDMSVNAFASTPFDTAVGGTQLEEGAYLFWNAGGTAGAAPFVSVKGYVPEAVWNESCSLAITRACSGDALAASAGGLSQVYERPSWQWFNPSHWRGVPDVAFSSARHDAYRYCYSGTGEPCLSDRSLAGARFFHGTSTAAPAFASMMAVVDEAMGGRQGLLNPTLYRLAMSDYAHGHLSACASSSRTDPARRPACAFNDVRDGDNAILCTQGRLGCHMGHGGYPALPGYDFATGLGSVNAAALVNAWRQLLQ